MVTLYCDTKTLERTYTFDWPCRNVRTRERGVTSLSKIRFSSVARRRFEGQARRPTADGNEDAGSCNLGFHPSSQRTRRPLSCLLYTDRLHFAICLSKPLQKFISVLGPSSSKHFRNPPSPSAAIFKPNTRVFHPARPEISPSWLHVRLMPPRGQLLLDFPRCRDVFLISRSERLKIPFSLGKVLF